ncbi:MAG TPA: SRPBCC domain-containing protein, partial [Candidatus Limnocylindria bacterium]|nr:SRPBCC domain-containing protein [Candidatus Limnocylindria bacterium]
MGAPQHVFQVYIRATPERLWQAITDPAMTQIYYFNSRIESDFTVGSPLQYKQPDGSLDIDGEVLEADPPRKLVHSFTSKWDANEDPPTTVTWEITPMGSETCLVSMTHSGFPSENAT